MRRLTCRWLLPVLVLGGLVVVGKLVVDRRAAPKADAPAGAEAVAVTVDPVTPRPIRRTVPAVGSLWGWEEVPITPKVEGRVVRVHKFVGDTVKPGDVLVEIDPTDFQLAVSEAERGLELELSRLGLAEVPSPGFSVMSLPSVVRAEALERQTKAKAARLRASPRAAVSEEELQQADTEVEVARANVRQAELEARSTLAAVRHRQAALRTAEQRLADTTIVAPRPNPPDAPGVPAAGEYVIAFRKVAAGETVRIIPFADAPPLFRLVIDRPLKLQLTFPERHLAEVQVGQEVELEVEAYPGERFTGTVARVNRTVDRASRTFTAEVAIPNTDRRLSAGSFAKAAVITRVDGQARTVPEEALVSFAGVTKVFVLADGKAREVRVSPGVAVVVPEGNRNRTWVEIDADLPPRTAVITSGQSRLADGAAVRVRE